MAPGADSTPRPGPSVHEAEALHRFRSVAEEVRDFLEGREGSALRAWMKHFDRNNDSKISQNEFMRGMRRLNFAGDANAAFAVLDRDKSGELSLDEVDLEQSTTWRAFCAWCVASFEGPREMLAHLSRSSAPTDKVRIDRETFVESLRRSGWSGGLEEVIHSSLDVEDQGVISSANLRWLEMEKRRQRRKDQAKARAMKDHLKRTKSQKESADLLKDFKAYLKRRYGNYVRAWRRALSQGDDAMTLKKNDIFKACVNMGWQGDVRLLWHAFDKDDSGYVSIEELDAKSAVDLAHFKAFVTAKFGSAVAAFRALDRYNTKKIKELEFVAQVKMHGFNFPTKSLFHGLDHQGNKAIVEEDVNFLDRWKPPAFLLADPNSQAADEVKTQLVRQYKNYLKAWRHCLDVDSSNRVNWEEFESACGKLGYTGDSPGAWRALDTDLSGYITLREIDPEASDTLLGFKRWAEEEFGGVRSAFQVFDSDGSNEVSYREFRRACRAYGFNRDVHALFHALDVERNGLLGLDEVQFLDDWDITDMLDPPLDEGPHDHAAELVSVALEWEVAEFWTDGPGPAAYALPTTMGAGPTAPMLQFSGAFSFRKKCHGPLCPLPGVAKDAGLTPSACSYDPGAGLKATGRGKPAWGFGTSPRTSNEAEQPFSEPGPGSYATPRHRATAVACSPRRPLRMHPLLGRVEARHVAPVARAR